MQTNAAPIVAGVWIYNAEPTNEFGFRLKGDTTQIIIADNAQSCITEHRQHGCTLFLKTAYPARPVALWSSQNSQIAILRLHGAGKHIAQQFTNPDGDGDFPVILILCEKDGKVVARTLDYAFQLPIYCQEILTTLMDKLIETAGGDS